MFIYDTSLLLFLAVIIFGFLIPFAIHRNKRNDIKRKVRDTTHTYCTRNNIDILHNIDDINDIINVTTDEFIYGKYNMSNVVLFNYMIEKRAFKLLKKTYV